MPLPTPTPSTPPSPTSYAILHPTVFDPRLPLSHLQHLRLHPTHTIATSTHPFAAPANPWLYSPAPTTTTANDDDDDDGLDADILERNLATGHIGECGERGCRVAVGCVDCVGLRLSPTPRTGFRNALAAAGGGGVRVEVEVEVRQGDGYPTHLQRMEAAPLDMGGLGGVGVGGGVGAGAGGGAGGPRIKYCKKRPAEEALGADVGVERRPHKSRAQLAALLRRRRKKG